MSAALLIVHLTFADHPGPPQRTTLKPGVGDPVLTPPVRLRLTAPQATATPHDVRVALQDRLGSSAAAETDLSLSGPIDAQDAALVADQGEESSPRQDAWPAGFETLPEPNSGLIGGPMIPPVSYGPMEGQLDPYRARAAELPISEPGAAWDSSTAADLADSPLDPQADLELWWQHAVSAPLGLSEETLPVDVSGLVQVALAASPLVRAVLTEPKIRQNELVIADAEFDTLTFIETKYADTNDPVGDRLTTGPNPSLTDRLLDQTLSSAAGIRKKSRYGGSLELAQRGGFQENNSTFLLPNPQGTTRLEINFTQPLLQGSGRAVNNTRVLLARLDLQVTRNNVRRDLEDHLLAVTRAYWELYAARAEWLQRNRLLESATELGQILTARTAVDSHQRQVLRASAAIASRRSDLIRAETRIRNAQARLRLLTGDSRLASSVRLELIPQDQPPLVPIPISTRDATFVALENRADLATAIRKIQAVSARVGAARNQVLPRLDLILSGYAAGLDDGRDTFGAWVNQFSDGRPSYAAGLLFELPVGNRANRARLARNRWELTRSIYEFQQTTEQTFAEVEVAVRETRTSLNEMLAKKQAIDAAEREVEYLQQRWELLPDPRESAILLIENLLDAQVRLADEERALTRAQVDYAISWIQLQKTMGILLQFHHPAQPPWGEAHDEMLAAPDPGSGAPRP